MNKYGDYTQAELKNLMRPTPSTPRSQSKNRATATHVDKDKDKDLPTYVNWVERGAVNPPKDQGVSQKFLRNFQEHYQKTTKVFISYIA